MRGRLLLPGTDGATRVREGGRQILIASAA